ncbi:MAG: hypothetical protein IPG81_34165 [Sandaracinaceae bacterium]|nr:hypothetical protein [Sandaracinaceae bacterium]
MYGNGIHTLHGTVPDDAEFVRLRVLGAPRLGGAARGDQPAAPAGSSATTTSSAPQRRAGATASWVRTMIAWDRRWYITHLSDFHSRRPVIG